MFKVVSEPTFTHTVTVMTPIDGGHKAETFQATYRLLDTDVASDFDLTTRDGITGFLTRAIVRFDELVGENEQPMPYNDALRDQLLKMPHVRVGLSNAYFEALSKDPPAKN